MRIWIDLDNSPHVPFFCPIVRALEQAGYAITLTYRDAFQVGALVQRCHLPARRIGRYSGRNRLGKLAGLLWRSLQLMPAIVSPKPSLAVSHGSRAQMVVGALLRIPVVLIDDYEHSWYPPFARPDWWIIPDCIRPEAVSHVSGRVRHYDGIKEDVYVPEFTPDDRLRNDLGLADSDIVATVRPPATSAHYHDPASERLFAAAMDRLWDSAGVKVVLLPRDRRQLEALECTQSLWFRSGRLVVPSAAVDGLNLIWHSDLVVSGGGTMNREAAALGVPAFSIFRGPLAAVDRHLEAQGRLVLLSSVAEVLQRLDPRPRPRTAWVPPASRPACAQIVATIADILDPQGHLVSPPPLHPAPAAP